MSSLNLLKGEDIVHFKLIFVIRVNSVDIDSEIIKVPARRPVRYRKFNRFSLGLFGRAGSIAVVLSLILREPESIESELVLEGGELSFPVGLGLCVSPVGVEDRERVGLS